MKLFTVAHKLEKLAGRRSRKDLQKDLQFAKDRYSKLKNSVESKQESLADLNSALDREQSELSELRAMVLKLYDALKNLDLLGLDTVKFVGDDVAYVKKQRIYRLEEGEGGELNLVPWRSKREADAEDSEELSEEETEEGSEEQDPEDWLANLLGG